jgi:hypothetical protein
MWWPAPQRGGRWPDDQLRRRTGTCMCWNTQGDHSPHAERDTCTHQHRRQVSRAERARSSTCQTAAVGAHNTAIGGRWDSLMGMAACTPPGACPGTTQGRASYGMAHTPPQGVHTPGISNLASYAADRTGMYNATPGSTNINVRGSTWFAYFLRNTPHTVCEMGATKMRLATDMLLYQIHMAT